MDINFRYCKAVLAVLGLLCFVSMLEVQHIYSPASFRLPSAIDMISGIKFSSEIKDKRGNGFELIEKTFQARNKRLSSVCKDQNVTRDPRYDHLFNSFSMVDMERDVLLCRIPKIASTGFIKIFLALGGLLNVFDMTDGRAHAKDVLSKLTFVRDLNSSRDLQGFKKFIFVRDPLERLLSAYTDKLLPKLNPVKHGSDRDVIYSTLNKLYNNYPGLNKSKITHFDKKNGTLSFREFLQFVTDWYSTGSVITNNHFLDYHNICRVCNVTYDFIGKYETFKQDVRYIFDRLDINFTFPSYKPRTNKTRHTTDLMEHYYRPLPLELRKKVYEFVKIDALLFGYTFPKWFMNI